MEVGNILKNFPNDPGGELFDMLVQNDKVKIERIVSRGHTSPATGWHDQNKDEWVIVIKGEATLSFEHGEEINLKVGNYINIPAHKKHRVTWTSLETETVWLAVHY